MAAWAAQLRPARLTPCTTVITPEATPEAMARNRTLIADVPRAPDPKAIA